MIPGSAERPLPVREFSPRAVAAAIVVAIVVSASYPYVVLKLGFGPNISVVSAFFGYLLMAFLLRRRDYTKLENNIVMAAGNSAGQTAFMCVLLAAFDMLSQKPELHVQIHLKALQVFLWLLTTGLMGALASVPLRRHFIDEEQLAFPDGVAAAETVLVLDAGGHKAKRSAQALALGGLAAMIITWFRDGWPRVIKGLFNHHKISAATRDFMNRFTLPDAWFLGLGDRLHLRALNFGLSPSLLSVGSGFIIGLRVSLSMGLGMLLSWILGAPLLSHYGLIESISYKMTLRWVMWPATGLMISGGLTALILRWRMLARTFTSLSARSVDSGEFPLRIVGIGLVLLSALLVIVQKISLGIPAWQSLIAISLSIPLMLVSLRVVGETNWAPISQMGNMMQAVFALIAPGQIPANMAASGMTGSIVAGSEGLMYNYKTGKIIGSNNRRLTYAQLMAVPIGAAAVALVYPILASKYGVGEGGLSAPTAVKWAGFAELLSKGFGALPPGCVLAFVISVVLGVVITVGEQRWRKYLPSPTGIGIGMLIPGTAIFMIVIGGIIEGIWKRRAPRSADELMIALGSGFIAGEAILAVLLPILMVFGVLPE